jgi:hypothetical protein
MGIGFSKNSTIGFSRDKLLLSPFHLEEQRGFKLQGTQNPTNQGKA